MAQRYEVEGWAGEPTLYETPEQYEQVVGAILASGATAEADWLAIMEHVTGTLDLAARGNAVASARAALRAGVVAAVRGGMSESEAARQAGVTRMTVRSWLGK